MHSEQRNVELNSVIFLFSVSHCFCLFHCTENAKMQKKKQNPTTTHFLDWIVCCLDGVMRNERHKKKWYNFKWAEFLFLFFLFVCFRCPVVIQSTQRVIYDGSLVSGKYTHTHTHSRETWKKATINNELQVVHLANVSIKQSKERLTESMWVSNYIFLRAALHLRFYYLFEFLWFFFLVFFQFSCCLFGWWCIHSHTHRL